MDVGRLLRDTRLQHGFDQAQLAQRAGTTQTYISRVERGAVSPSTTTLARLFAAMGLRLSLTLEPLEHGNVSADRLQADWRTLSAKERIDEAMELSEFLTGVAASASDARGRHGTR